MESTLDFFSKAESSDPIDIFVGIAYRFAPRMLKRPHPGTISKKLLVPALNLLRSLDPISPMFLLGEDSNVTVCNET
jgi:hypothetical protein